MKCENCGANRTEVKSCAYCGDGPYYIGLDGACGGVDGVFKVKPMVGGKGKPHKQNTKRRVCKK